MTDDQLFFYLLCKLRRAAYPGSIFFGGTFMSAYSFSFMTYSSSSKTVTRCRFQTNSISIYACTTLQVAQLVNACSAACQALLGVSSREPRQRLPKHRYQRAPHVVACYWHPNVVYFLCCQEFQCCPPRCQAMSARKFASICGARLPPTAPIENYTCQVLALK